MKAKDLDSPYPLTQARITQFKKDGFIKLKDVLRPETIEAFRPEIREQAFRATGNTKPMQDRSTYEKAFLQVGNLWGKNEKIREFTFSRRLARIATQLLEVDGVRLYHDQALYKEPGGGITPWHADQFYWPLGSDRTITVWIPLQETPLELGPLAFAAGSQELIQGRDIAISDESEEVLRKSLADFDKDETPYELGEVSFHLGWTFHRAAPNVSKKPREVMTVIYMDKDIKVIKPQRKAQQNDLEKFLVGAQIGGIPDGPLNPVLYDSSEGTSS